MSAGSTYLSDFILQHMEAILQSSENYTSQIEAPAVTMDSSAWRNHAAHMLSVIAKDLRNPQSAAGQFEKAQGRGPRGDAKTAAETHAMQRLKSGSTISQLISEYRALRYTVLRLWAQSAQSAQSEQPTLPTLPADYPITENVARFNEAIDQAIAESVTEYVRLTEAQLKNQGLHLKAVLDAVPAGIGMADAAGRMILTNPEMARIWGRHPLSQTVDEYSDWKGWWADGSDKEGRLVLPHEWPLARALAGDETPRDVMSIAPFDAPDHRRTIVLHARPITDLSASVVGAVVAQMDITGQVQVEQALRESEEKFRTIANAMPQMVWSTLANGQHDYYNQQWYDFTGAADGSTDGAGWNDMFHPEDQAAARARWTHCVTTGETYEIQYRLRHRSGEYRWTLGRALPVRNEAGRIIRWMGTCTDIHNQKLAEDELRASNTRKDEFLAMLAHELRNPLAPISTAAHLLKRPQLNEMQVRRASEIISRQVNHMTNLVDDLLDVSRLTRGLTALRLEDLDLNMLIHNAVEQTRPLLDARGHQLRLNIAATAAHISGDKTRLVQVLANVLNNAAKYTPKNGEIDVTMDIQPPWVTIAVKDNGSGIEPALLPHVFELFIQGERTPDRGQGGLGLGLALVKSITALHGGVVEASSDGFGKGTTISITLPLSAVKVPHSDVARNESVCVAGALRIMLVDDNLDATELLGELLKFEGHDVSIYHDAIDALRAKELNRVQVFILDIGLPDIDGYELARRLRATTSGARATLIALTGYGQAHDRALSESAGFDYHLVKPYTLTDLTAIISQVHA